MSRRDGTVADAGVVAVKQSAIAHAVAAGGICGAGTAHRACSPSDPGLGWYSRGGGNDSRDRDAGWRRTARCWRRSTCDFSGQSFVQEDLATTRDRHQLAGARGGRGAVGAGRVQHLGGLPRDGAKQLIFIASRSACMMLFQAVNYQTIGRWAWAFYVVQHDAGVYTLRRRSRCRAIVPFVHETQGAFTRGSTSAR